MSSTKAKTWVACDPTSTTGRLIHLSPDELQPGMQAAPLGMEQYLPCVQDATDKYAPIRQNDGTCKCLKVPVAFRGQLGGGLTEKACSSACATPDNPTAMYTCSEDGSCDPSPGICGSTLAEGEAMGCFPTKEKCHQSPGFCRRRPEGPRVWAQLPTVLQSQVDVSDPRLCKPFHEKTLKQELAQSLSMYNAMNAQKNPAFKPISLVQRDCNSVTVDNPLKENEWCMFPPHTPQDKITHISMEVGDKKHTQQCTPGYCVPVKEGVWGNPSIESNPAGEFYGKPCGPPVGKMCPGGIECIGGYCDQFGNCVIQRPKGRACGPNGLHCDDGERCLHYKNSVGGKVFKCIPKKIKCGDEVCTRKETCVENVAGNYSCENLGPRSGYSAYAAPSPYVYAGHGLNAPVAGMSPQVGSDLYFVDNDAIY